MTARNEHLLTLDEAAAYLRVHRRTLARLLQQGVVPGSKIGRQWRVRRTDLDTVLAAGTPREAGHNGKEPARPRHE